MGLFSCPPMPLETQPQPLGLPHWVPSMPNNLEKVHNYHQPVKRATLFRSNLFILLLQVPSLILNNLHYIVSDLWKAARPAQIIEKKRYFGIVKRIFVYYIFAYREQNVVTMELMASRLQLPKGVTIVFLSLVRHQLELLNQIKSVETTWVLSLQQA